MINLELRKNIEELNDQAVLFTNPEFDNSILGLDQDGRVVYSFSGMIRELMDDEHISEDDACDFIDYNTMGVLNNIEEKVRPVIVDESIWYGLYE